jgi:hypothetical protein
LVLRSKTFTLNEVEFHELEAFTENNKRYYTTPTGEKYPSVTTVLGSRDKSWLYEWRKKVGEEEANRISQRASNRGTRLHKICEDIMASMVGEEEEETVLLEDPMRLIFRRMPTGQTVLMMMPWLPVELIKDNSALIYNTDIVTIIDPKESMVQYYDNLVTKTLLEMEKSEEMIEQLLKDQQDEGEEEESEEYMEELTNFLEEIKNRTLH